MNERTWTLAGIACFAYAALLPVAFLVSGFEGAVLEAGYGDRVTLMMGDFLFLGLCGLTVFILLSLKGMLFERYSFRGLDPVIYATIAWSIVNYFGSFLLVVGFAIAAPSATELAQAVIAGFWALCIVVYGVLDAVMGGILLFQQHRLGVWLTIFGGLTLVGGLLGMSFILAFFCLVLIPVGSLVLAVEFLRPVDSIEIV